MYPEISSRLRAIEDELNGKNFYHVDRRLGKVLDLLRGGLEFLGKKIYELERERGQQQRDPHRYLPGSDD